METSRPAHNGRGFVKEVGIVVLGVCLALVAQQAVDWLHWQGEVVTARQAIHAEIARNNIFFAFRIAVATCLKRQAAEAERILDNLEAKRPPGRFTTFQQGQGTALRDNEWQNERAAQSLTHFPRAELVQLGEHYAPFATITELTQEESTNWRVLSVLRRPPKEMPVSDLLRLRTALEMVKSDEWVITRAAQRQLRRGREMGLADPPADQERYAKFCTLNIDDYIPYLLSLEPRP